MAVVKCKMCGGDMELSPDMTVGTCEYCGSTMTVPKADDQQRAAAFDRGNHFRRLGEFDKALSVYERIVQEDENDAEAHWCCALCRFGIEYVKDPASGEYLPTCHRASFDSFLEDVDYQAALSHADPVARRQYEKDGGQIAAVQRGILATVQKEEPFDVFLCYKESDENGRRTVDSTLAQDIYYQLTEQGRRVFFARITLEDKAGQEYEPYIFSALHSAKVMVVVGTRPEYLNAVWVKNEWSRYLALMKSDRKRLLIPCYRDMDPYDLPEQLSVLQSYDMGKIGFIQDLIRGVAKVLDADKKPEVRETVVVQGEGGSLTALLKRGNMALEDREWDKADEFFEQALNIDAECAQAYFGKALAAQQCRTAQELTRKRRQPGHRKPVTLIACEEDAARIDAAVERCVIPGYLEEKTVREAMGSFQRGYSSTAGAWQEALSREDSYWKQDKLMGRAVRFAKGDFAAQLAAMRETICGALKETLDRQNDQDREQKKTVSAGYAAFLDEAENKLDALHREAARRRDADEAAAEKKRADAYAAACKAMERAGTPEGCRTAAALFGKLEDYRDSRERVRQCEEEAKRLQAERERAEREREEEAARRAAEEERQRREAEEQERKKQELLERQRAAKMKKLGIAGGVAAAVVIVIGIVFATVILPGGKYNEAEELLAGGDAVGAALAFGGAGGYRDAQARSRELWADVLGYRTIAAGSRSTTAVLNDGTVASAGHDVIFGGAYMSSEEISAIEDGWKEWTDIVSVAAGQERYGLHPDGTVESTGEALNWKNIVAIDAGSGHVVGLKSDGTVVASGRNADGQCNVGGWRDIVAIAASSSCTAGLKRDGTVVVEGSDYYSRRAVQDWTDIVAIAAGSGHTVGLKADGTVVAVGDNEYGQCDVSGWSDIVAIDAGYEYTVGLHADGTVVATKWSGKYYSGQGDVEDWTDVVEIAVGGSHTVALRSDGTLISAGSLEDGRRSGLSDWTNIRMPEGK